jgi:hypothetical protein
MKKLLLLLLLLMLLGFSTLNYSSSLLCGTMGIKCEKVDVSEVLLRDGHVYKKFATEKFTGEVTGQQQYKVINGLKEGKLIAYHSSGTLMVKGYFTRGLRTGRWDNYRENGQLMSFHHYQNGQLDGPMEYYYQNGLLLYKGAYKDDLQHGKWWIYDIDNTGVLKYERIYENGKIIWENGKTVY